MKTTLSKAGNDVRKATEIFIKTAGNFLTDTFNDILKGIGLSKTTSSVYKISTNRRDRDTNCLFYEFWRKTTKTVGIWPFRKKKATRTKLNITPLETCVESVLQKTKDAIIAHNNKMRAQRRLTETRNAEREGTAAKDITKSKLVGNGLSCSLNFKTEMGRITEKTIRKFGGISFNPFKFWFSTIRVKVYMVPLDIVCSTPKILSHGTLSRTRFSITISGELHERKFDHKQEHNQCFGR